MSTLAHLPAEANADETLAAVLDALEARAQARGLEGVAELDLIAEGRSAMAELVTEADRLAGELMEANRELEEAR